MENSARLRNPSVLDQLTKQLPSASGCTAEIRARISDEMYRVVAGEQILLMDQILKSLGFDGQDEVFLRRVKSHLATDYFAAGITEGKFRGDEWIKSNENATQNLIGRLAGR